MLTDESFGQLSWGLSEASGNQLAENTFPWRVLDLLGGSARLAVTAEASSHVPGCALGIWIPGMQLWLLVSCAGLHCLFPVCPWAPTCDIHKHVMIVHAQP